MATEIIIKSQKFFNEFKNGKNFAYSLTDYTANLTGNIMEKVKASFIFDISWGLKASPTKSVASVPSNNTLILSSGIFKDEGFSVGGTFDFHYTNDLGSFLIANILIDSISGSTMYVTSSYPLPDSSLNNFLNEKVVLIGKTLLSSLIYKFGLVENADIFSSNNIITNSEQAYYIGGISQVFNAPFQELLPLGNVRDWRSGKASVKAIATGIYGIQRFEFEHEFIIPFYSDGDDFINLPSYLFGLNSLKYTFNAEFRSVLSNPDSSKSFTYDSSSGAVGYYNENFNGFNNNYTIEDVTYKEANTLQNASGIIADGRTLVTVKVSTNGVFSGVDRFGVYVANQTKQNDYTNTASSFIDNFIYDSQLNVSNVPGNNGNSFIYNNKAVISGAFLIISFEVEYTTIQKLYLSQKMATGVEKSIISISIGDSTLSNGNSNRVMLLADTSIYDFNADVPNLIKNTDFKLFTYDSDLVNDVGYTSVDQWNEDGVILKGAFDLNISKNAKLNSLEFLLIAENANTGKFFKLDSYIFNVANAPIIAGVQQFNFNNDRGYPLSVGDGFNNAKLITSTSPIVGGLKTVNFELGQKISWQDWIPNNDVDNVFFDASKQNNNLNLKASNYSFLNGYNIKIAIFSNVYGMDDQGITGATNYLISSAKLDVNDYNEDNNITPEWSGVISTYSESTGNDLQGAILTGNENTIFKTTWTNVNGAVAVITDLKALSRIEEKNQNGYNINEFGDSRALPNNNKLYPKVGFSEIDIYLNAGNVVTECLIKGSDLQQGIDYSLSSKIWSTTPIVFAKLTSPNNLTKITSGVSFTKIPS